MDLYMNTSTAVTTARFIDMIFKEYSDVLGPDYTIKQARAEGWLEMQEEFSLDEFIERRIVARILHEFLRKKLGEKDEDNWQPAQSLKDLYDCHICVNHVAQMYVKGIMREIAPNIFGTRGYVKEHAALRYIKSLRDNSLRRKMVITQVSKPNSDSYGNIGSADGITAGKVEATDGSVIENAALADSSIDASCESTDSKKWATKLTLDEALGIYESLDGAYLIDVHVPSVFEESHLEGAINYPMAELVSKYSEGAEADEKIHFNTDDVIILYCKQGYQSEIAANCLAQVGFEKVYYFGLNE